MVIAAQSPMADQYHGAPAADAPNATKSAMPPTAYRAARLHRPSGPLPDIGDPTLLDRRCDTAVIHGGRLDREPNAVPFYG